MFLHDQVTARLSPEYFNSNAVPHHKKLLDDISQELLKSGMPGLAEKVKTSPTLIAAIWGVAATAPVGGGGRVAGLLRYFLGGPEGTLDAEGAPVG